MSPHVSVRSGRARQRGATLIVSLIMLMLITLLAVTSFRLGKGNLQIAGNMQQRTQALSAAQGTIEKVLSSVQFTQTPNTPIPAAGGPTNLESVDVNGDSVPDVNVTASATCDSIQPIPVIALDFSNPNDAGCLIGAAQDFGVAGAANNNSMCANSVWDVSASATDIVTGANYVVSEGAAVRVPVTTVCP